MLTPPHPGLVGHVFEILRRGTFVPGPVAGLPAAAAGQFDREGDTVGAIHDGDQIRFLVFGWNPETSLLEWGLMTPPEAGVAGLGPYLVTEGTARILRDPTTSILRNIVFHEARSYYLEPHWPANAALGVARLVELPKDSAA